MKKYYFEKKYIYLTKFQLFQLRQFFVQVFNMKKFYCEKIIFDEMAAL